MYVCVFFTDADNAQRPISELIIVSRFSFSFWTRTTAAHRGNTVECARRRMRRLYKTGRLLNGLCGFISGGE